MVKHEVYDEVEADLKTVIILVLTTLLLIVFWKSVKLIIMWKPNGRALLLGDVNNNVGPLFVIVLKQDSEMITLAAHPWESLIATRDKKRGDTRMGNVFTSSGSHERLWSDWLSPTPTLNCISLTWLLWFSS